jgi:hypothetical protein
MELVVATESDLITTEVVKAEMATRIGTEDKDKGKQHSRHVSVSAIMKALTPKEQQRHLGEQLCLKCHKPGHRLLSALTFAARLRTRRTRKIHGGRAAPMMDMSSR